MRKFILFLLAMCVNIAAFAGSECKVIEGDKKFFKKAEGKAIIEFNFDDATYDGKMPLGEKWKIDELKKIAVFGFMEEFNDRCKKVEVVGDATDVKY